MDHFIVDGGRKLKGTVKVHGSKNAALPILIATLLTDEPCVIHNVPNLRDIRTTFRLIEHLGKRVRYEGSTVFVEPHRKLDTWAPYDIVKQMRASVLVAGPLLARFQQVRVALPGGCAIGLRPIDIHLKAFEALGAKVSRARGDVVLKGKLQPRKVKFRFPSVGATEDVMMAAAGTLGKTVIENAAREPEIEDLADFLNQLGAHVRGAGTRRIEIVGALKLRGAEHTVIPDRLEAGTFLLAAAATGGNARVLGAKSSHLSAVLTALRRAGAKVREEHGDISISGTGRPRAVSVKTEPYPGFPTDLQAPWMSYMCLARGKTKIQEKLFEKRFIHAAELGRMGARIELAGDTAVVEGVAELTGAPIMASDIRAGAALIVAALAAKGRTVIQRVYHIDRGYERIERKLAALGARISRVDKLPPL